MRSVLFFITPKKLTVVSLSEYIFDTRVQDVESISAEWGLSACLLMGPQDAKKTKLTIIDRV